MEGCHPCYVYAWKPGLSGHRLTDYPCLIYPNASKKRVCVCDRDGWRRWLLRLEVVLGFRGFLFSFGIREIILNRLLLDYYCKSDFSFSYYYLYIIIPEKLIS